MIIEQEERDVITGGTLTNKTFTISSNAQAFKILSDKLYANKIRSILRELSSNALDAHIDAGTQTKPFELDISTVMFRLRDYGTGMSSDKIMALYSTYFMSDKNVNNDKLGCFGLGSKSPFAYAKSFSIKSWFNGEVTTWSATMNDDGIPELYLLSRIPTTEPTGLEISFRIKNNSDYYEFMEEARALYSFFPVQPKCNFDLGKKLEVLLKGSNWEVVKPGGKSGIVMGNIFYPVDTYSYSFGDYSWSLLYYVKIGDVDVTPSREQLEMTNKTKKKLEELKKQVQKEYTEQVEKELVGLSEFAKIVYLLKLEGPNKSLYSKAFNTYFNIPTTAVLKDPQNPKSGYIQQATTPFEKFNIIDRKSKYTDYLTVTAGLKIIINDIQGTKGWCMEQRGRWLVVEPEHETEMLKLLGAVKSDTILASSVVVKKPRAPRGTVVRKPTIALFKGNTENVDPKKTLLYTVYNNRTSIEQIEERCFDKYQLDMIEQYLPFYRVHITHEKRVKKLGMRRVTVADIKAALPKYVKRVPDTVDYFKHLNQELKDFYKKYKEATKKMPDKIFHDQLEDDSWVKEYNSYFVKYPMLELLNFHYNHEGHAKCLAKFI